MPPTFSPPPPYADTGEGNQNHSQKHNLDHTDDNIFDDNNKASTFKVPSSTGSSSSGSSPTGSSVVGPHSPTDVGPFTIKAPSEGSSSDTYSSTWSSAVRVATFKVPSASSSSTGTSSSGSFTESSSIGPLLCSSSSSAYPSTSSSSTGSSLNGLPSTGTFYSCISDNPQLLGNRILTAKPSHLPSPHNTTNNYPSTDTVPSFFPSSSWPTAPFDPSLSGHPPLVSSGDQSTWSFSCASPHRPITRGYPEKSDFVGRLASFGHGARQQKQLRTPPQAPGPRRFVDLFVDDWMRKSCEKRVSDVASMVREDEIDGTSQRQWRLVRQKGRYQPHTPTYTPSSRGSRQVPARAEAGDGDNDKDNNNNNTIGSLNDLKGLSLEDDDDADDEYDGHRPTPSHPAFRGSRSELRPRDSLGRFVRCPSGEVAAVPRRHNAGVPKNKKGGRRGKRRRTEVELTMYHAIRWLGLGGVVPNLSVVTMGPLVRMPLPCTFGDGPSRKPKEEEEEEDFMVGAAKALVRAGERRWAERVRRMGKGV